MRRRRSVVGSLSVLALVLALVPHAGARAFLVGAPRLSSPRQAPWSVLVEAGTSDHVDQACSGSIIDATHVLTAAHCFYYQEHDEAPIPVSAFTVSAGNSPTGFDGFEHSLVQTITRADACFSGMSSVLCASSQNGTACQGDSGAGLVLGGRPTLVGVENYSNGNCVPGDRNAYVDLSSPEIANWLNGEAAPTAAPRTSSLPKLTKPVRVGSRLTCRSPAWSGSPMLTIEFVDPTRTRAVLQRGAPSYRVPPVELDRQIECVVMAQNDGGTTYAASAPVAVLAARRPPR
jgi:hypothetical protein